MIHFKRFHHIQLCIPTGKESEARNFYGDLIGLKEIPRPQEINSIPGLWFQVGDIELHIRTEDEINKSKRHPAFEVADINSARAHLEMSGVKIQEEIQLPGLSRFTFYDPFGNRIEFLQVI